MTLTPVAPRNPKLTAAQAKAFSKSQVLAKAGPLAAPVLDPWVPGVPEQPRWSITVDPGQPSAPGRVRHVQEAVSLLIAKAQSVGAGGLAEIRLAPGTHAGPVILPNVALPKTGETGGLRFVLRGAGAERSHLTCAIDAEMPGSEFASRFHKTLSLADSATRAWLEGLGQQKTLTTGTAAVLRIEAPGSTVTGLTVTNAYRCDRPSAAPADCAPRADGSFARGQHQAVAVMTCADRVHLRDLRLESHQDTLYLYAPKNQIHRVAVERCHIEGDVDFIFGQATGWFENCTLLSLEHRAAQSWVTAPSTHLRQPYGFVFSGCDLRSEQQQNAREGRVFLGRQWFEGVRASPYQRTLPHGPVQVGPRAQHGPEGNRISLDTLHSVGKCVFLHCAMDAGYNAVGPWTAWNGGYFDRHGLWHDKPGQPRYRPVQTSGADFLKDLGPWLAQQGLDYADLDPEVPWLGLFDCRFG